MNVVFDCIILGALIYGFVRGLIIGMTKQAFSMGGIILGIILGTLLYKPFADFLRQTMNMPDRPASILAFIIILLIVPVICGFVGKLISRVIHAACLGFVDRLLGAFFGLFSALLIMGLIFMLLDMTGISDKIVNNEDKKQSKLYQPVSDFTGFCLQWTWDKVKDSAEELIPDLKDRKDHKDTDKSDQQKV